MPTQATPAIEIYSATGQLVRALSPGSLPAGSHRLEWDGTDSNSHDVASGVYVVVMKVDDITESVKITLLR